MTDVHETRSIGTHDESALVRALQAGDTRAFETLLDAHLDHLRAFIALKLPVAHLVNEIAHESFVFAYRNIHNFEAGTSFRAWLRAIAANLIRAEVQRFRREEVNRLGYARQQSLQQDLANGPAPAAPEVEYLEECVAALPPAMRELIALKYQQELSIETIAGRLRRTQTAIWQTLFRLRHQLKLCIEGKLAK